MHHDTPNDPPTVATIHDPETGAEYDQAWTWETGVAYANQGYVVRAVADDGYVTIDQAQAMYDRERSLVIDCFGTGQVRD